jgi:DENN (AEX-3) domain
MVPMVPATLASDLVQYPAPFILGVPSEEAENEHLIANLPRDVTLVDLDVGRVILAPDFGLDNEMVQKSENPGATASALRSQVLYLAQTLGSIFGSRLKPETWMCDRLLPSGTVLGTESPPTDIEGFKQAAKSFVGELLEGVCACSYWIEEVPQTNGGASEPTVLFDEDKFFEIKNHRAKLTHKTLFPKASKGELALNLNDFDLVLESFLRCQSMSTYISSRPKTDMVFY